MGTDSGYTVNEDGSVSRVNRGSSGNNSNNSSNGTSGNGGCIWGIIIVAIIIAIILLMKNNGTSTSSPEKTDTVEVVEVGEEVVEPVYNTVATVRTFPKSSLSDVCSRQRMDETYGGYILVPHFLSNRSLDEDGWIVYSGSNGAYLTSVIIDYDGSAYQFISQLSNGLNSTYSTHKTDWAVDSGFYGNQIYYMKAVKSGGRIYCAAFFVPRGDKQNAKLYTRLTEKIFNSTNFPLW